MGGYPPCASLQNMGPHFRGRAGGPRKSLHNPGHSDSVDPTGFDLGAIFFFCIENGGIVSSGGGGAIKTTGISHNLGPGGRGETII